MTLQNWGKFYTEFILISTDLLKCKMQQNNTEEKATEQTKTQWTTWMFNSYV